MENIYIKNIYKEYSENGYYIIRNVLSEDNCNSIITEIRIPIQSVNTSLERVSRTPLDKSIVCQKYFYRER